jgi:protein TonB
MTLAPRPAVFTWNVAMVASPSEAPQPSAIPSTSIHPPLKPSSPTPSTIASTAPAPDASSIKAAAVESAVPGEEEPTDVREQGPSVSDSLPRMEVGEEPQPIDQVTSAAETVASQPSIRPSEPVSEVSSTAALARESSTPDQVPSAVVSSVQRTDYSWLSEAIIRRMHELKKYPAEARLDHAEGKVVLKVIIKSDGGIKAVEIFQSSGHQSLDRAAVDLLNLAAPFHFPRPFERPQVTVRIPMSYRLSP